VVGGWWGVGGGGGVPHTHASDFEHLIMVKGIIPRNVTLHSIILFNMS
jgi:hypothetical protein